MDHIVIKLHEPTPLCVLIERIFSKATKIQVMRTAIGHNGMRLPKVIRVFYKF